MKRRSHSGWTSRTPVHHINRNPMGTYPTDYLLSEIREHAGRGERVRVGRLGFRSFDIVRNDTRWLVLPVIGNLVPVGTFDNVCAAVMAGDRYVEAVRRGEYDDEDDHHPRGTA